MKPRNAPGSKVKKEKMAEDGLLKAALRFAPTRPEEVFASLVFDGEPKTLEEMEAGIAAEAKRRYARHRH